MIPNIKGFGKMRTRDFLTLVHLLILTITISMVSAAYTQDTETVIELNRCAVVFAP